MSTAKNQPQNYKDDLAALLAGELPQSRVREILAASERDPELARALAEQKSLDRLLNFYAVPEPSAALRKSFWARFHNDKLLGSSGMLESRPGSRLWLKIAGPIAAGVLITVGLIFFGGNGNKTVEPGAGDGSGVAEVPGDNPADEEVVYDLDTQFFDSVAGHHEDTRGSLRAEELRKLKLLDDPRLALLDGLKDAADINLIDDIDLLADLDREEGP